jgi:hypothetical protein
MKQIISIILFLASSYVYCQNLTDTCIYVSAKLNGLNNTNTYIDNDWLSRKHCFELQIDTFKINQIEQETYSRKSLTDSFRLEKTKFTGLTLRYYNFVDSDLEQKNIYGDRNSVYFLSNSELIKKSKIEKISIVIGGTSIDTKFFDLDNGCLDKITIEFLKYLYENKKRELNKDYNVYRLLITPTLTIDNKNKIDLNDTKLKM